MNQLSDHKYISLAPRVFQTKSRANCVKIDTNIVSIQIRATLLPVQKASHTATLLPAALESYARHHG